MWNRIRHKVTPYCWKPETRNGTETVPGHHRLKFHQRRSRTFPHVRSAFATTRRLNQRHGEHCLPPSLTIQRSQQVSRTSRNESCPTVVFFTPPTFIWTAHCKS